MTNSICPGCGLQLPANPADAYDGYFHASAECWALFAETIGRDYGDVVRFSQVHQLTVDAYAAQHPGGAHPNKSVDIHLCGLYLVLERRLRPMQVPRYLQTLAAAVERWPHFPPPAARGGGMTIFDVALAGDSPAAIDRVWDWSQAVWASWAAFHEEVAALAHRHLALD